MQPSRLPNSCLASPIPIAFLLALRHKLSSEYVPTDFFETSAMLITFILLGKYLEAAAKVRGEWREGGQEKQTLQEVREGGGYRQKTGGVRLGRGAWRGIRRAV